MPWVGITRHNGDQDKYVTSSYGAFSLVRNAISEQKIEI